MSNKKLIPQISNRKEKKIESDIGEALKILIKSVKAFEPRCKK
jgi:hypothetical protein